MKAFLLGFYLVLSLTKVSASSLRDLCDEFIKNNLSNPANITFNYLTDTENITRLKGMAADIKDKELDLSNFKNETKNKIKKRKTENDKVINNFDKQLTSLRQSTNERFHGVGQKITASNDNINNLYQKLTNLGERK